MKIEEHNIGRTVLCDICNEDWTDRAESGGFIFRGKAYCPTCAQKALPCIRAYREEHLIRACCPAGLPFGEFVRRYRGGDGKITVYSFDDAEEMRRSLHAQRTEGRSYHETKHYTHRFYPVIHDSTI